MGGCHGKKPVQLARRVMAEANGDGWTAVPVRRRSTAGSPLRLDVASAKPRQRAKSPRNRFALSDSLRSPRRVRRIPASETPAPVPRPPARQPVRPRIDQHFQARLAPSLQATGDDTDSAMSRSRLIGFMMIVFVAVVFFFPNPSIKPIHSDFFGRSPKLFCPGASCFDDTSIEEAATYRVYSAIECLTSLSPSQRWVACNTGVDSTPTRLTNMLDSAAQHNLSVLMHVHSNVASDAFLSVLNKSLASTHFAQGNRVMISTNAMLLTRKLRAIFPEASLIMTCDCRWSAMCWLTCPGIMAHAALGTSGVMTSSETPHFVLQQWLHKGLFVTVRGASTPTAAAAVARMGGGVVPQSMQSIYAHPVLNVFGEASWQLAI